MASLHRLGQPNTFLASLAVTGGGAGLGRARVYDAQKHVLDRDHARVALVGRIPRRGDRRAQFVQPAVQHAAQRVGAD